MVHKKATNVIGNIGYDQKLRKLKPRFKYATNPLLTDLDKFEENYKDY